MNILAPIIAFLTTIFNGIHSFILSAFGMQSNGTSYVLTIFLLTLIIRLLILPLNIKASKSQVKMQEIQPQLNAVKKKYANDPQKMNAESAKIMKENNVSMMGGCLPSLLPMPILFALYYVFRAIDISSVVDPSFLWIPNVFAHDKLYILPVLAFLSSYLPGLLLSKSTPKPEEGGMNMGNMNLSMGLVMAFMSASFSAILVIYWIIGGAIQLVQTYFVNYLPAKKRMEAKREEEEFKSIVNAKKATPKTKKNN